MNIRTDAIKEIEQINAIGTHQNSKDDDCEGNKEDLQFSFLSKPLCLIKTTQTNNDDVKKKSLPSSYIAKFETDGFVVFPNFFSSQTVSALNERLEYILRGTYDRGQPDKAPRLVKSQIPQSSLRNTKNNNNHNDKTYDSRKQAKGPLGFSGNLQNVKVLQIINTHKCDHLFRSLVICEEIAKVVTILAGWKYGARLAQDQIWAKPPGASPLAFHRDSPYFMFEPSDVVTVWIALDDMEEVIGPLQYVKGSHKWGDGRIGSSNTFFEGGTNLLESAAKRAGIEDETLLEIVSMAGLKAGGISIHDGRTWHGSGKNQSSTKPRRGIGLHYVPAQVQWTPDANQSSLWKKYVVGHPEDQVANIPISEDDFPLCYSKPQ